MNINLEILTQNKEKIKNYIFDSKDKSITNIVIYHDNSESSWTRFLVLSKQDAFSELDAFISLYTRELHIDEYWDIKSLNLEDTLNILNLWMFGNTIQGHDSFLNLDFSVKESTEAKKTIENYAKNILITEQYDGFSKTDKVLSSLKVNDKLENKKALADYDLFSIKTCLSLKNNFGIDFLFYETSTNYVLYCDCPYRG